MRQNRFISFKNFFFSMYKKSKGRVRTIPPSRSAQITVFMILGLLILFIFIFVFSLSAGLKKEQLQEIQEKTLTKTFKKEALRIFVEDCLTDELEKGLILIGKQGRLWSGQPGGTRNFEEGISGAAVGNDRVFYGIIRDPYLEYENAYPCSNESSPEEFCQYAYPNIKVGFGSLELRTSTIQNDLRRYLLNKTVSCVSDYVKGDISSNVVLESQEINLNLAIHDSGIDVKVNYPLKLSLGNEEFFHLSQFDFFYPTKFKALLDTAVSFPLRMDWQYVDFGYNKTTLESPYFTYGNEAEVQGGNCLLSANLISENFFLCSQALFSEQYASLGIEMSRQPLLDGDDLFIFKSASILNTPELYTYQFARQNRPPALDYIHRLECPAAGYDYLVIKDDLELGIINLTLFALDPDEDTVSYAIQNEEIGTLPLSNQNYLQKNVVEQKTPYIYRAYATDEHQINDWQDVRVLVDRPLELDVSLFMSYKFRTADGEWKDYSGENGIFPIGDTYLISKEDPSFLKIVFPQNSLAPPSSYWQEVSLLYSNKNGTGTEHFQYKIPEGLQIDGNQGCFSFPGGISKSADCTLAGYKNDIAAWSQLLSSAEAFPHFREVTEKGELNLSFSAQYCARFNETKSDVIKVVVNDCVPHRNQAHPWAYSPSGNHEYVYESFNFDTWEGKCKEDENGKCMKEKKINPFEATHSCCIGADPNDWQIAKVEYNKVCFSNPEPGCYGQVYRDEEGIEPYTTQGRKNPSNKDDLGLVVEIQQQFCDGERGNICQGQIKNDFYEGRLFCGSPEFNQCRTDIPSECQGLFAFSLIEGKGWCSGTLGCKNLCTDPVVYIGAEESTSFYSEEINNIASNLKINSEDDVNFDFKCGCTAENQICDSNFDGKFNGVCQADNSCLGDA